MVKISLDVCYNSNMFCDKLTTAKIQARLDAGQTIAFEKPAIVMLTGSKGRRDIVRAAGLDWILLKNNFDEEAAKQDESLVNTPKKAAGYSKGLAEAKLKAVKAYFKNAAVICADTVVFNKKLIEKPKTEAEVYAMIRGLNGSKHQVITGVSIYDCRGNNARTLRFASVSEVLLSGVTDGLIAETIKKENPYACSGGYTIDGILEPCFKVLSGSKDNVIGLPLKEILAAIGGNMANNGKTVLVTGASRGIGRAVALRFAKEGYNVAAGYLNSEKLAKGLKKGIEKSGGVCEIYKADISDFEQTAAMVDAVLKRFKKIDVLVNNAGVSENRLFTSLKFGDWRGMTAVNLDGLFNCTRPVAEDMLKRHDGCIINISSVWGIVGASCEVAYSTTKAAAIGFTKALAKELGPSGVRVNCVAPGVINTDMLECLSPRDIDELRCRTPLQRIGTAEDIASVVFYLAKEEAAFLTGQVISSSGGFEG